MGKLLLTIGLIGLCHAAYSATQHRNYIRLTEKDQQLDDRLSSSLPLDIFIQTLLSLILTCVALVPLVARFRPIRIASDWETKNWFNIGNRVPFYSFNHRGKYLSGLEETFAEAQQVSGNEPEEVGEQIYGEEEHSASGEE